jgi:lipopolysaccharide/colanic/teichoic acid biosynthesis glycosyltransferase
VITPAQLRKKRALDLAIAIPGLVVALPLLAWIGWRVRRESGSPVFFLQRRPGFRNRPFTILKFRTMVQVRDQAGVLATDAERLTRVGRWLRQSSLDELPELLNVIQGEMSLVGPRPLLPRYLVRYTPEQARRHEVPPGITGWAQVNGRNALSWEQKFELDVWYVDNWSVALDCKILWLTLGKVLRGEGISARGHATMPEFMGSDETDSS